MFSRQRCIALTLLLLVASFVVSLSLQAKTKPQAQKRRLPTKTWYTHWNGPPRYKPEVRKFDPSVEVPSDPAKFNWILTIARLQQPGKKGGVPVYRYDEMKHGKLVFTGQRAEGMPVEVTGLFARRGTHFYEVQSLDPAAKNDRFWVAGYYLEATAKP